MRVLLLEDDLNLCDTIEEALGKESYSVDSCHDGETAMLYALNTDLGYELAIVDRMLPIIDGPDDHKVHAAKRNQHPCHYHHGDVRLG